MARQSVPRRWTTRTSCWEGEHPRGVTFELTLTSVHQSGGGAADRERSRWAPCWRSAWREEPGADAVPHRAAKGASWSTR